MEKNHKVDAVAQKLAKLANLRQRITRLPAEQALQSILDTPEPAALVHSIAAQDVYLLIQDLGREASLPLLALASGRQWEYLLDIEIWQRDRIDWDLLADWSQRLLRADPHRLARWAATEKVALFTQYLYKNIHVQMREHDQDPAELGTQYFTLDGTHYIRILDHPTDHADPDDEAAQAFAKQRRQFIEDLMRRLAEADYTRLVQILIEAMNVLPAEAEESQFRWRNVRLAEKGFLPFTEAIAVYQPLTPAGLSRFDRRLSGRDDLATDSPVPLFTGGMLGGDNPFGDACQCLDDDSESQRILNELALLSNQLIVADAKPIRSRGDLKAAVDKVIGYINIALETLATSAPRVDPVELIRFHPLLALFRVGYGVAMALKQTTEQWYRGSWAAQKGLKLDFWGQQWLGVLGGLMLKKPLFFDDYQRGVIYRDFDRLQDIDQTRSALDAAIALDHLLAALDLDPGLIDRDQLSYKNLLLTHWARSELDLHDASQPLTLAGFGPFFTRIFGRSTAASDRTALVTVATKQQFSNWLRETGRLADDTRIQAAGPVLDSLFDELEAQFGPVAAADLDLRYLAAYFWLNPPNDPPQS